MAAALKIEELSLNAAYERATRLANTSGSTTEALDLLEHCEQLLSKAALFSSNEDKDDLQTSCIRYLLVPFLKAELLNSQTGQSPPDRMQVLQAAGEAYSAFLQRCHQYGFLNEASSDSYKAEEQGMQQDPSTCRSQKIERFKRSKAVAGLLQHMNSRKTHADEEADTQGATPGGVGGWDDEDERMLWQLQVEAGAIKALDARCLVKQEMQLLEHVVKQRQQQHQQDSSSKNSTNSLPTGSSAATRDASQDKASRHREPQQQRQQQMLDSLVGIAGQLGLHDRQAIRQQVFRPSHILPTMTVEQQGAIELRELQRREAVAAQAAAARPVGKAEQSSDDDGDADDDDKLAKARAWDDFKDDNPKGWGNSTLRPCA